MERPGVSRRQRLHRLRDAVITFALLTTVVGVWWFAIEGSRQAEEAAIEVAFQQAEGDAAAADLFVRHLAADSRQLAALAQRWLRLSAPPENGRRAELEASIRQLLQPGDLTVGHLTIADAQGRIRWHTITDGLNTDLSNRPHFNGHVDGHPGPLVGRPLVKRATGELVIPISWRLEDANGGFIGVAVMQYLPERLSTHLAQISARPTSRVAIFNLDGAYLAGSFLMPERLGEVLIPSDTLRDLETTPRLRRRMQQFGTGQPSIVALRRVADANLVVVASMDEASVMAPAQEVRLLAQLTAGAHTLVVLLGIGFGYGVLRNWRLRREAAMLRQGRAEVERLHTKLPAVIFLRDVAPDGSSRVVYRAGDVRRVTGWENGELDGKLDWDDYITEPAEHRATLSMTALRNGSAEKFFDLRLPSGGVRRMVTRLERLSVRADGGGEVVGYVRDYTAEQRATDRDDEIRRELESTLALAPVVVFRARVWACAACTWRSGKGCYRVDYISRSIERVTGWTQEALAAAGGLPAVLTPWESMLEGIEAMRTETDWGSEFQMRRPDGEQIIVRITSSVVTHHFDGMDVVGYIADVTEERDAKARAIGSARLASLGELAAGLAHELKQPLQAIELGVSNAQSAARRGNMAAVEQRLDRIAAYSRRAAGVVEHLRRLARGADELAPREPMVLEESIAAVLSMLAGPLRDAGVEVAQEYDTHPLVAMGHAVALEQVMMNLIANARDALSHLPGDARRLVTIRGRTAPAGDGVVLTVSDNGGGIPAKVMERLFQPFVSTKGLERGTGLGLSICQGLIRHMGGTIAAVNDEQGAVFTITLPGATSTVQELAEPLRAAAE